MKTKIRLGIIGNSSQVRDFHIAECLAQRAGGNGDVELVWGSGCLCSEKEREHCPFREHGMVQHDGNNCHPKDWQELLKTDPVDAVLISIPNMLHASAIRTALEAGAHVAVDKPPVVSSDECWELVKLASKKNLHFVTLAQRRFETVYQLMRKEIGAVGDPTLIDYRIVTGMRPHGWRALKSLTGGGILIDSAFHGIDVILWLLRHSPQAQGMTPQTVSAEWRMDTDQIPPEAVELVASVRVRMSNGCLFSINASYIGPKGTADENIKIFGEGATLRFVRDKTTHGDMSSGTLSLLHQLDGRLLEIHDGGSKGDRTAPLRNFLDVLVGKEPEILSPAADSIVPLRIIEAAYESAAKGGIPVPLKMNSDTVQAIDHVAVQTSDLEKALAFYVGILGAEILERRRFKRREMAWLRVGTTKIELFSKRDGETLHAWNDYYSGPVHLAFRVADLDTFLARAMEKGAQLHPSHPQPFVPPVEGACRIAYLLGPDGEEVEVRTGE